MTIIIYGILQQLQSSAFLLSLSTPMSLWLLACTELNFSHTAGQPLDTARLGPAARWKQGKYK